MKDLKTSITNNSGRTQSLWMEYQLPEFAPLTKNVAVDVCVVGGGIAGISCAYVLAKRGVSVALIDRSKIGGGQSARTTAHLTWVLDDRFFELERIFGVEKTRLAAQSHSEAIDAIEHFIEQENISCDFKRLDGFLFAPPHDSKILDKEWKALKKAGLHSEWVKKAPWKTYDTGRCIRFLNQAQFHILKYLDGILKAFLGMGGQAYCYTPAQTIEDTKPCLVKTPKGKIEAEHVIVATCTPVNDRVTMHTKQAAYRTYVIGALIPKNETISEALYWDTLDPYHYIRLQPCPQDTSKTWLIVGGEDHKTGQKTSVKQSYKTLTDWTKKRFGFIDVKYQWSGQVFEPVDCLAFIGKNPHNNNIWIATGDSGNGMTHGTIAGLLIPDLMEKKNHPWRDLYDPSRKSLSTLGKFVEENINTLIQYKDWLTPGENKSLEELPKDCGTIIRKGAKKIAIYKDPTGQLHLRSAICTHLGACLRWNDGEKSWDCPAHGSRFNGCGEVLNGPALSNLTKEINRP